MAQQATPTDLPPVTEAEFFADRQHFAAAFGKFTVGASIAVVVVLIIFYLAGTYL